MSQGKDQIVSPLYLNPKNTYEEALFPLLREALVKGYEIRDREVYSDADISEKALGEAFDNGAEAMADQLSEDYFGGTLNARRQFMNPYTEDEEGRPKVYPSAV